MSFALNNPMTWLQFKLRGGVKTLVTTTIGYTVIIGGLIILSLRPEPKAASSVCYYWTNGLMALQIATIMLFAPGAIRNSIRRDNTTRMIESHRLMPVPATQAITGIIIGSNVQFLVLMAGTFFIGSLTCAGAGIELKNWILANAIVGIFGFSFWFAASLFAFLPAIGITMLSMLIMGGLMSNGLVLKILPGLGVLVTPMIDRTVFGIIEKGGQWHWGYQAGALGQISGAALCYLAAVRKYKREDQLAFTPAMGLILLAGWVLLCHIGTRYADVFETTMWRFRAGETELTMLGMGSAISTMLIALVPVIGAAWLHKVWDDRRRLGDKFLGVRPVSVNLVVIACVAIAIALRLPSRLVTPVESVLIAAATAGCFLFATAYLLRIMYRASTRTMLPLLLLLIITWVMPLLIDFARWAATSADPDENVLTMIGTCSPIGTLYAMFERRDLAPWPGLIIQTIPAISLGILYHTTRRKRPVQP